MKGSQPGYEDMHLFFGDLHNHCGISYGHGSLEDALNNARERLDFCSVTGHAHWPDMPAVNERNRPVIEYHRAGFSKLRKNWSAVRRTMEAWNQEESFLTFLGFEIHSNASGDYTVLYRDFTGSLLYPDSIGTLKKQLQDLSRRGIEALAFPHHTGYLKGARGINWDDLSETRSPIVEIVSMHGCSETDESPRPFLHTMGPSDWEGTAQYGLGLGHVFGFIGSTDHHSAHPGSYGHGMTGIWAQSLTRREIWQALKERRTYALTGDRIDLRFLLNGRMMGSVLPPVKRRAIDLEVRAGGAIDYVDVVKNSRILRRFTMPDVDAGGRETGGIVHTKLFLQVGWGQTGTRVDWDVTFGITDGRILSVEPRFRGGEIVAPLADRDTPPERYYFSHWERVDDASVHFRTVTFGNPNVSTFGTQGVCLDVEMPREADVFLIANGKRAEVPLARLMEGARSGYLDEVNTSPAWRLDRAASPKEYHWKFQLEDVQTTGNGKDYYYVRVRQTNNQWAWSSPIFTAVGEPGQA